MSKPKSAIGSVKRRGLAIATAVAVAGGGFVPANYAFAQEETDPTQEELEREFGGTEADAIAQEAARKAYDALVAGKHDDVDKSLLEGLNEAAGLEGSGFSKEDLNAIGEEELKYQIGELVDEEKHRYAKANNNQGNSGESASEDATSQSAPTVQQVFDREKEAIKSLLKDSKSPEEAAQIVAGKVKSEIEVSKFKKFEYALERLVKKYFAELVDSGDVKLGDAYTVPTPEKAFEENKDTIAAELKKSQDPDAVGKSVARKYLAGFEGDTAGFGKFEYALERLVKKYFAELVDSGDVKLGDAYTVPTPEKAFEENKDTIAAELKKSQDPDAVGKSVARKYLAGFEGDTAGFGKFEYALERLVKKYFAELVDSGDVKLGEQYASPAPDAYFASYKKIISADLRSMVGKTDDAVNQITDKHFDELKRVGFTFGDEQAEGAWKSDFRELVQELANELQAAEAGAHRAVLDNELGVNSNPVVDPNEESLTAEDLAAPFAKHRDEVAEQEAVEAAEDLVEAKRAAKAAIDGAQHLSDAQKVAYKGAVDAASTERQVEELVYGALDGAEQAEDYAKIQEQLGSNGTPAFSPNEKPWTPEDFLNSFRQNAANEAAKKLEETKSAATADVEGAARLTEYQKSEFKDRIGAAKTVEEVKAVLDEAHKLVDKLASEDEEKATLEKEKQEAHRIIDGLNKLSLEQKAAFKKQVDDANTGAYVAHIVERAQEVNAQQYPSGDGAGAQEPGKPGSDNKPGQDQKPGSTTDAFKGFFGLAAGLGVFALIFGGILHTINHFDGFGVVQEHVRNAFAKIGIRF